ncbi:MAG: HIT family protein [Candidatus Pacebacteria bacterium]|nr:HIT family protein [Candidatus Paceibacterota bacterium]
MDCIFCKIINNEILSFKVYEDADVLAFLDVNPAAEGHTLVIPKKHFENIFDIDSAYLEKVGAAAKKIAEKMKESLGAQGVNLYHGSGRAAEQGVFHFHLHVVPRRTGDGIDFTAAIERKGKKLSPDEMESVRKKLSLV